MSTREGSLGAWADKIPQVAGHVGRPSWETAVTEQLPLTPQDMATEIKGVGLLLLIGIGCFLGSGILLLWSASLVLGGEETVGVVVDMERRRSREGELYAPIVAYYAEGEQYEYESSVATSWKTYEIGDEVSMVYAPDDPQHATINSFQNLYLLPTILCGGGLVFTLGGLGLGAYVAKRSGWRLRGGGVRV
jgi:hypothetical protein